ncbi:hypothetical protein L202_02145 [Cryptococcus amylolentus CBS 6039]|uniref:DH domain-containing protein n=1 Tax=Cryptococcus amylolentus CBS 6039 TaxID=1295533 RepID=A0A1E3HZL8_9TREE|nr:hypothetical protein L202_02145 [Cryptococcus amylolentus CBS 6039]ODN81762.1 hypothetical protein L202_02145 [Cryptococcus amylolentus CBS 6039]
MPALPTPLPPTPTPSIHSPTMQSSAELNTSKSTIMSEQDQPIAGPSKSGQQTSYFPQPYLPPTPPVQDGEQPGSAASINFVEPVIPRRRNPSARRPLSAYPQDDEDRIHPPSRKYTDPTPVSHLPSSDDEESGDSHQLDVDLDAYSNTGFETEEEPLEDREPTLSFVTASTHESTAGTPPMSMTYSFPGQVEEGRDTVEPKIRLRSTAGRGANTYSSAESSIGSGPYSYHAYGDQIYQQNPPPLPQMPSGYNSSMGLGISTEYSWPASLASSQTSRPPVLSPSNTFPHRPWKRDVVTRLRSGSASSAFTVASTSTDASDGSSSRANMQDGAFHYDYDGLLPYEREQAEPEALAMIKEGREKILDVEKIEALGGVEAIDQHMVHSLAGITHLLLPSCGPQIVGFLSPLLSVLAPSLVVLDLSNNNLSAIPDTLQHCTSLEELNLSDNPLWNIPNWIGALVGLRVLVMDGCGISSLPEEICHLHALHSICVRRNKLVALPTWLCLLAQLDTLKVDNNPFTPEWLRIIPPILEPPPRKLPAAGKRNSHHHRHLSINNGLRTPVSATPITSPTSSAGHTDQGMASGPSSSAQSSFYQAGLGPIAEDNHPHSAPIRADGEDLPFPGMMPEAQVSRGLRKMRSAGALLNKMNQSVGSQSPSIRPRDLSPPPTDRFASLGGSDGRRAASAMSNYAEDSSEPTGSRLGKSSVQKPGKLGGFLRKMSMNRLRPEKDKMAAVASSAASNLKTMPALPPMRHQHSDPIKPVAIRPGMLGAMSSATLPTRKITDLHISDFGPVSLVPTGPSTMPLAGLPFPSQMGASTSGMGTSNNTTSLRGKRRSFLPLDGPPSINVQIPTSEFHDPHAAETPVPTLTMEAPTPLATTPPPIMSQALVESPVAENDYDAKYAQGLDTIKLILRDLHDLSRKSIPHDTFAAMSGVGSADSSYATSSVLSEHPGSPRSVDRDSVVDVHRARRHTLERDSRELSNGGGGYVDLGEKEPSLSGKKFKNDKSKRAKIIHEIWETERTYVRNLGELVTIYVKPSAKVVNPNKSAVETVVPSSERKIVFGGIESILAIHRDNFLPALEKVVKTLIESEGKADDGEMSIETAYRVGEVFRTYIAYMKQYSTYITNFDNALARMKTWSGTSSGTSTPTFPGKAGSNMSSTAINAGMSAISLPSAAPTASGPQMSSSQKKRVKAFLQKGKDHPMHSQISLESYLLLPIQRIPRYKLLLTELAMCTPARADGFRDTLDDALIEISSLASLMNEEKRDADSRLRLINWQKRFTNSGRSPLVQPHRRLMFEGPLTLSRIVKKASNFAERETMLETDGDKTITSSKTVVPVDHVVPESVEREVMLILCSDMMVLATQRGEGWEGPVNVFNVLRMGTLQEPASVTSGNTLRVVDNNSIYYFTGNTRDTIIQWCRAINTARR